MKYILPVLTVLVFAITPYAYAMETTRTTMVSYHADWCGGCKVLEPKMEKVMEMLDADTKAQLTRVKFDFTDDASKAASKARAEEKGLAAIFPAGEGKMPTGFINVIDTETGTVLAKIHYKMSEEEIAGALKAVTTRS